MIDLDFLKNNTEEAKELFKLRGCTVNVDEFLKLNSKLNSKKTELDKMRSMQKKAGSIEEAKKLKVDISALNAEVSELEKERDDLWLIMPNILAPNTPVGTSDADNFEIKRCGSLPVFNFEPKSHAEIGKELGILDLERGAKVSGSGFYYIVGEGANLAFAVYYLAWQILVKHGFTFMFPPVFSTLRTFLGTGYFPFEPEGNYKVEGQNLYAIGTSEQTLLAYHDNEIIDYSRLPLKYSAMTPCFRTEAGSYGKCSKGAFRVHQFHKMEQIIFCDPSESEKYHEECLSTIEELLTLLEVPYRIVRVCTGDMGAPGYKKYDVECWFPSFGGYRETHSNTNLWDFQTRRLNIRVVHEENGKKRKFLPHTVSSTMATDRLLWSIIENFQQKDGSVVLPQAIANIMGKKVILPPS